MILRKFSNILYISYGLGDEGEALKQALSIARNYSASLKILILHSQLPELMQVHHKQYEALLTQHVEEKIESALAQLSSEAMPSIEIVLQESGSAPANSIVQHVLREGHDLVIKNAQMLEGGKGFRALDMELLRKCPCPVWLCRPISYSRDAIRVAVAVDPYFRDEAEHAMSVRLLQLARSIADDCNKTLDVISCWDFEFEDYLRNNAWTKISEDEVDQAVNHAHENHENKMQLLLSEADIKGNICPHLLRGNPEALIPNFVKKNGVDILVMGTVARTGIAGFFIGNTAENILQQVECSLVAMKPQGFVSPVKAY